ncbi:MAG: RdgB/HAM1 family non-canonical purine NTP pyrophosphatase [Pseudomonadales bacterium]|nr:RdgB/HAM1 family non-canonical purine NTP pyrophosphatase [Pseudomonadales bacterium]
MRYVLASDNEHKIQEIRDLLPAHVQLLKQSDFHIESAAETGLTFIENALLKARHATAASGLPAIADDSGLEVDALGGRPGIYSSRFAGEQATDRDNVQKLLTEMVGCAIRSARFRCVMVMLRHEFDPAPVIAEGSLEGEILYETRGNSGFGYDSVFFLPDRHRSVAELPLSEKNRISHRAQALQKLIPTLL